MIVWVAEAVAAPPLDAVVLVEEGAATCAGSFIDDHGTVATAYHCVASGGRPLVTAHDGRHTVGRVIGVDRANDLALIAAPDLVGTAFLSVRAAPPVIGETAWALGHPMGARPPGGFLVGTLRWSASEGVVSGVGARAVQVTAPVNPGNSGGPIVDADGALLGVVSRRLKGDGLGFASRASNLEQLVAQPPRGLSPLGGTLGADLTGWSWGARDGTLSAGARAEVSFRDRVVISGMFGVPYQAKWDAQRFGSISWMASEGRLGLRQRVFRGPLAMKFDAYGGRTVIARIDQDPVRGGVGSTATGWSAGGDVTLPGMNLGFDVARVWLPDDPGQWRVGLVYTWPGTVWMF